MNNQRFQLIILEEAKEFLKSLPIQARRKVVATHGIIKKTQKTPSKEITKAEEIRKKYFETKNNK